MTGIVFAFVVVMALFLWLPTRRSHGSSKLLTGRTDVMSKNWYVVHAYSGMEKASSATCSSASSASGMQDKFGRILVPTEEVVEMKNGKKAITERSFFPGYVLVEMVMDDDTWHLVKHTSKVTGFVGGAREPAGADLRSEVMKIVQPDAGRHREAAAQGAVRGGRSWCASRKARSPTSTARSRK